ncbi:TIGR02452 family protein [Sandaracinus amylolyticus]|nr:TIGR02452 family protein [Sandaracinus amylolyticus]
MTNKLNRKRRQEIAEETVAILRAGRYVAPSGREVDVERAIGDAIAGTTLHTPERPPPRAIPSARPTIITVANETTLAGARRLHDEGRRVAALVFGSARNPGGGFLGGSEAQEESLARASALYACEEGSPFYQHHRARRDPSYSHHVIHAPDVPVLRDDAGTLLEAPWPCSFLVAAAPNRRELDPDEDTAPVMAERIARILDVAAAHEHRALVLGAFGCGVFRNDPIEVAGLFASALEGSHAGVFDVVRFSVLDTSEEGATFRAFAARFDRA